MRVLIVDDETIIAHDLQGILEDFGHTVVGAVATAKDAIALTISLRPDIALLDIHLRGSEDGITVGQALHEQFHVPVVYLTAHADADTLRRAVATAPFGYLSKPFHPQTLRSTIEVAHHRFLIERQRQLDAAELQQANAQLGASVAAMEQHTAEAGVLSVLGGALLRCATVEESYAVITDAARRLFRAADGMLYIQRSHTLLVEAVAAWGDGLPVPPPLLDRQACGALRYGEVRSSLDGDQGCSCLLAPPDAQRQLICVPLIIEGSTCGLLHLRMPASADPARAAATGLDRKRLATILAEQAALGLGNVRMRIALREQVVRDPLTGLFNRRYLEETLIREQSRAARSHYPVGIIMLDIDHFKRVNDTWGHSAGDVTLIAIGRLLMANVRVEDVVCRYGGEEFVLVLPSASAAVTLMRAEQIRRQVQELRIVYDGQELPPISISAGVSSVASQITDVVEVLRQVDEALYQAKHAGRNCIVVAAQRKGESDE